MQSKIDKFAPKAPLEKFKKENYWPGVTSHLTNLFSFSMRSADIDAKKMHLNLRYYFGLEQVAFENSIALEHCAPKPINWKSVEKDTGNLYDRVFEAFKNAENKERTQDFLEHTKDQIENYFIYDAMHQDSPFNPWAPILKTISSGLLVKPEEATSQKTSKNSLSTIGFSSKGKGPKALKNGIGNIYHLQIMVYNFLKSSQSNHEKAYSLDKIAHYLKAKGYQLKKDHIQIHVTTPLKKTGLVGSSNAGFFIINNAADLLASYCFHYKKNSSIAHILRKYESISHKQFSIDGIESLCVSF